jgi:hypothetical protein
MEMNEIEQTLQERLGYLQRRVAEGFERPSWDSWLECYNALMQVRQTMAQEKHVEQIDTQNALLLRIAIGIESLNTGK